MGASQDIKFKPGADTSLFLSTAVVVAAKSTSDAYSPKTAFPPGPNSPQSTISTVEREIKEAGGEAAAFAVDVRDFASLQELVDKTLKVCLNIILNLQTKLADVHNLSDTAALMCSYTTPVRYGGPRSKTAP